MKRKKTKTQRHKQMLKFILALYKHKIVSGKLAMKLLKPGITKQKVLDRVKRLKQMGFNIRTIKPNGNKQKLYYLK